MDIKHAKNAFRSNKPKAGHPHGTKKGKKGYDRRQAKADLRTDHERSVDGEFDRDQDTRWQKAQSIAGQHCEITQVSDAGFYYRKGRDPVPVFHEWPKSKVATEGSTFGRVA